jgi:hypothetical protein
MEDVSSRAEAWGYGIVVAASKIANSRARFFLSFLKGDTPPLLSEYFLFYNIYLPFASTNFEKCDIISVFP